MTCMLVLFFVDSTVSLGPPQFREVSLLRLVESPPLSNTPESTAYGLLQHIAKVLGGSTQVQFRTPQVLKVLVQPGSYFVCVCVCSGTSTSF